MKYFILDVDGVMTTGQFLYDSSGKSHKIFGPDDSDGLKMIRNHLNIHFVSADERGFGISKMRINDDMGYKIDLVPSNERTKWIEENYSLSETIYMGDGIHDAKLIKECMYGIVPQNGRQEAKEVADFVTPSNSGEGAVLDACLKIKDIYFSK